MPWPPACVTDSRRLIVALQRVEDGSYGRSIRSGAPIPDERLEADPAAELTVQEAADDQAASR
jgi:RNA polymerase-binding transcription factor DksA